MTRRRGQIGHVVKARKKWYSTPEKFVSMRTEQFNQLREPKPAPSWPTPLGETVFKDRRTRGDRRTGQLGQAVNAKKHFFSEPERVVAMRTEHFNQLREPKPKAAWSTPLGETGFRERRKKR
jgi:hypothetical protein